MHEIVIKTLHGIWNVWRFRWTALLTAWLIATLGWVVVYKMEHKYFSSARIYVDTNQVLEPLLDGLAIQPDVKQRVALMSKTLLSRPNLEQLIEETNLSRDLARSEDIEAVLEKLYKDLSIYDASGLRSLYNIGYAHRDPETAIQVVQSLIDIFIDSNLGEAREDNSAAQVFLDDRIDAYEQRLAAAEKRLSDFKRENAGSMPGESGGYYQRIQMSQSELRSASLTLREAQNRRDELKRQLDSEKPVVLSQDPAWISPEESRILGLRDQLDGLLVRYTDRHPQVAQLRETIEELEEAREQSLAAEGSDNALSSNRRSNSAPSVVHQQVRTMLAEAEARVAELQVRVEQYQSELDDLKATVDSIPQVEAELAQLDRDYETINDQHSTLLARREAARLTEAVKKNSDNVKFRVVDPPYVSSTPGVPNKKKLNIGVLVGALAIGVGLSFLVSLLIPVFYDKRSLAVATGIPVLGGVTLQRSYYDKLRSWLGHVSFVTLSSLFLMTAGCLLYLQFRNIGLEELLATYRISVVTDALESDVYKQLINSELVVKLTHLLERFL